MIEKLLELLERFVVSQEMIAKAFSRTTTPDLDKEQPLNEKTRLSGTEETDTVEYPAEDDRDSWLKLCTERDIEVPPRTKTATLIKKVKEFDEANPSGVDLGMGSSSDAVDDKEDPFNTDSSDEKAEEATLDQVRESLQKVQADKGNSKVIEILKDAGGVNKLKELQEDKYAAVLKAAKNG